MTNRPAKRRAQLARESFVSAAPDRGLVVQSSDDQTVDWRFADGDPTAPTIRTGFITRAEANAVIETAHLEAEAPDPVPTPLQRARGILEGILGKPSVELVA